MADSRDDFAPEQTIARIVETVGPAPRTGASLVVIRGREIGRDFRLRRSAYVLGRDADCDIPIPDEVVSRRHARIEIAGDPSAGRRYWLCDMGSTNRTFVNGLPVERVELCDGDRIQLGGTILKFALLDEVEARVHREIRDRIHYDSLTGLLTRESIFLALDLELPRAINYGHPLCILMMDLDRFKSVNDTYGHLIGSRVLSMVGGVIREKLRTVDVSGRYGGEEFISYLSETPAHAGVEVAERVRGALEQQVLQDGDQAVRVTISIGVACYPDHGRDVTTLVERADTALYAAKEAGRNRVVLAS